MKNRIRIIIDLFRSLTIDQLKFILQLSILGLLLGKVVHMKSSLDSSIESLRHDLEMRCK